MHFNFSFQGLVAFGLLGFADAHMRLKSPVPFNVASPDNAPITGASYPCKSPGNSAAYSISAMNKIPVNEPVLLGFKGSAVHEGGTCQLSISLDKEPDVNSVFKVIQSIEGSCPIAEGQGGLTFNIPKDFPNVERATLAWTWFNKVGNREMYMDCAPIEVTGGSDNKDYYNSLPDMMKANLGDGCTTKESGDPVLPNPGAFVIRSPDFVSGEFLGSCGASAANGTAGSSNVKNFAAFTPPAKDANQVIPVSGGSSGSGASPSATSGGNDGMYTQPVATSTAAASSGGNDGQYTQPAATSAQSSSVATSTAAFSSAVPAISGSVSFQTMTIPASSNTASSDTASAYPTMSPSDGQGISGPSTGAAVPTGSSSSSGGTTGICTTDGAVVCNGPSQFGLCDHGKVVWQAVASGTTCSNGSIQKKRSVVIPRHPHGGHRAHFRYE